MGLELALFYFAEICGGFVAARALDRAVGVAAQRRAALKVLGTFALATVAGDACAAWREVPAALKGGSGLEELGLGDSRVWSPTLAFSLWGFSDAQVPIPPHSPHYLPISPHISLGLLRRAGPHPLPAWLVASTAT